MESPPSLGLGTINIVPYMEGLIFSKARVRSLGMEMGRCQAPNPTYFMGWLPLIMFQVLISLKAYSTYYSNTHTHTHSNMHLKQTTWHNHPQAQHSSIMALSIHHQGKQHYKADLNKHVTVSKHQNHGIQQNISCSLIISYSSNKKKCMSI